MAHSPGNGIIISNNIPGHLIKIEVKGRDENGQFTEISEVELTHGEFQEFNLPEGGSLQIFTKHHMD